MAAPTTSRPDGPVFHRAAGLVISAERVIPGFPRAAPGPPADVTFHLGSEPAWHGAPSHAIYTADYTDANQVAVVRVHRAPHGFHFDYADGTDVWLDAAGHTVWCTWADGAAFADTATYLTGPVIAFLLRLRGALALHASAVQVGECAVALVGPHGAGKSTAAAALGRRGWTVIADDVVRLTRAEGEWYAEPFAGLLRLWPVGAALALGPDQELPRLTPTWDKRGLDPVDRGMTAAAKPVRLGAVVFLEPRQPAPAAPRIDPIAPAPALIRLAAHSSAAHLLDAAARAVEFEALVRLVRDVPCACAVAATAADQFEAFVDAIERTSRAPATLQP